jgi:hypothetical protein
LLLVACARIFVNGTKDPPVRNGGRSLAPEIRQKGIQLLIAAGLGESYAQLVAEMWDAHNAGKIELEPGGEVRCGTTSLEEVLKGQLCGSQIG